MRFMIIVKANAGSEAGVLPKSEDLAAMGRYNEELIAAGVLLAADGLHPSSTGVRVRKENGQIKLIDGPFAETKELIAGYWLINVKSKDEALAWVRKIPFEPGMEVEVRKVFEASDFAVDSTGFGTSVYRRWFDAKYGREMKESTWVKAHVACGTLTNVVTAVRVTDSGGADCPQLPALLATTAQTFTVSEMSADKAYLSNDNLTAIEAVGAVPFIPFKTNSKQAGSPAWRRITRCSPCGRRSFWRPITSVPESRASSAP